MRLVTDFSSINDAIICLQKYDDSKSLQQLEIYRAIEGLEEIKLLYQSYKFKIALIGEFSAGKSSIINAIIGDEVLPINFTPTTNLINEISFAKKSYVELKGEPSTRTDLSQASIADLSAKNDNKRLNTVIQNMDHSFGNFVLFDTPGTNDPSSLSDDVVFDLVGEVDIVLFIMNANQAFRKSEVELLTKIVRKKDIEKFCFVLNHADNIDDPYLVKTNFVENIAQFIGKSTAEIKDSIFMMSAKNALVGKKLNKDNLINASGISTLEKSIMNYVSKTKEQLLTKALKRDLANQLALVYSSCEAFMDKLNGSYKKYQQQIDEIEHKINEFSQDIESEKITLKEELLALEGAFKNEIELAVNNVKKIAGNEIDTLPEDTIFNSRYIELRVKKLLEDMINEAVKTYVQSLGKLLASFDKEVMPKFNQHHVQIKPLYESNKGKYMLNALTAVGTVSAGVSVLPYAGGALAGASILGGIGAMPLALGAIPVAGPALAVIASVGAIAVPIIGAFAIGALGILVKVGAWGLKAAKNFSGVIEKKAQKMNYKREVNKALDNIKKEMMDKQEMALNFDKFVLEYIREKFPEKTILERKAATINEKYKDVATADQETVQIVNRLMEDILLMCE